MFKVRREQMDAYRAAALRGFEDRVVQHVERCFPDRLVTMGEGGVREVIRLGIGRAAEYGVVAERDVCKFIDLMLVLGVKFDQERSWAVDVLTSTSTDDPSKRMSLLVERALEKV